MSEIALVPVMTSDTTPSGEVTYSSRWTASGNYQGYYAFDGDDSTYWAAGANSPNEWISYEFPSEVVVNGIFIDAGNEGSSEDSYKLQYYNGSDWVDLFNYRAYGSGASEKYSFNNNKYARKYRVIFGGYSTHNTRTIQFYAVDNNTVDLLASRPYSSPVETNSITLNNLSKYKYLIAIIGDWAGVQYSRAQWVERTYLDQGTEIGYSIYNNTSSCITRTYKIPVTADTMTLTGVIWHYQILGIVGCEIDLIDDLTTEYTAENLITSFPLTNISKYSEILFVNDENWGGSVDESTFRTDLYTDQGTEVSCSGGRSNPSHFSITNKIPVSGNSMTVTGHIYYYQVFGLYKVEPIKATGSTEAIRDWFNASFYNKEEIENFFIQNNSGLQAYDLTIISDKPDRFIKLEGLDSGKIYNIYISALMGEDDNE